MNRRILLGSIVLVVSLVVGVVLDASQRTPKGGAKAPPVLNFKMTSLDGKEVDIQVAGKVVLFVNVASECGLHPAIQDTPGSPARKVRQGGV